MHFPELDFLLGFIITHYLIFAEFYTSPLAHTAFSRSVAIFISLSIERQFGLWKAIQSPFVVGEVTISLLCRIPCAHSWRLGSQFCYIFSHLSPRIVRVWCPVGVRLCCVSPREVSPSRIIAKYIYISQIQRRSICYVCILSS